jgi:PIN domain nuclease of toxin-antitoxin system
VQGPKTFVADTHALTWYLSDDTRLGEDARRTFERAERGDGSALIVVPTIVLAELLYLARKGVVSWQEALQAVSKIYWSRPGFEFHGLGVRDILTMHHLMTTERLDLEMHDLIILAAAYARAEAVLTVDASLQRQTVVPTVW